jgi:hypothetical protein
MFCPSLGSKQTQPGSALALPAAFADIKYPHKPICIFWLDAALKRFLRGLPHGVSGG